MQFSNGGRVEKLDHKLEHMAISQDMHSHSHHIQYRTPRVHTKTLFISADIPLTRRDTSGVNDEPVPASTPPFLPKARLVLKISLLGPSGLVNVELNERVTALMPH